MRITNGEALCGHGNKEGRRALVQILEAGLQATDPYDNVTKLLHVEGQWLTINNPLFEPRDSPVKSYIRYRRR